MGVVALCTSPQYRAFGQKWEEWPIPPRCWAALQVDLTRSEWWAERNSLEFCRGRCTVLHLGRSTPGPSAGWAGPWRAALQSRTWAAGPFQRDPSVLRGPMLHAGAEAYSLGPDLVQMLVLSTLLRVALLSSGLQSSTPFSPWESAGQNISLQNTFDVLLPWVFVTEKEWNNQ